MANLPANVSANSAAISAFPNQFPNPEQLKSYLSAFTAVTGASNPFSIENILANASSNNNNSSSPPNSGNSGDSRNSPLNSNGVSRQPPMGLQPPSLVQSPMVGLFPAGFRLPMGGFPFPWAAAASLYASQPEAFGKSNQSFFFKT